MDFGTIIGTFVNIPSMLIVGGGTIAGSPIAFNRTAEGRAKNRRVEMLYSKEMVAEKLSAANK